MRNSALLLSASVLLLIGCREAETPTKPVDVESPTEPLGETEGAEGSTGNRTLATGPTTPVRVGLDGPDMDACGTYAEVSGLDPSGGNYLSVRAAPTTAAEELARLDPGTGVSVCESQNGFAGIVYVGDGQDLADCGVGSPVAAEQEYAGPCPSGWVSEQFLTMLAG